MSEVPLYNHKLTVSINEVICEVYCLLRRASSPSQLRDLNPVKRFRLDSTRSNVPNSNVVHHFEAPSVIAPWGLSVTAIVRSSAKTKAPTLWV